MKSRRELAIEHDRKIRVSRCFSNKVPVLLYVYRRGNIEVWIQKNLFSHHDVFPLIEIN